MHLNINANVRFRTVGLQTPYTPVVCKPPEVDNGFGVCGLKECLAGTVRNGSTGQCQTPPTCAAAKTYDNASNTCKLYPLNCPFHSASTAND